ncbi:HIT family protein [Nosocomiicoccus sp. HMSC09A07]|uniref:HIT family protein n=1 Tax=Nosocomiicoccus sp. HMSC09A07 TaxID=1581145 RepID=UPI0008A33922|nr:HIT family protein [Nosocomiicoccus sp. HMSC09A07]OFS63251.1 hypothetical protein HMPREF3177_03695 [Nosocomiicoccus sp. HMSC09A07]
MNNELYESIKNKDYHLIRESIYSIAILDKRPATKGHILVMPKMPIETFGDIDNKVVRGDLMALMHKVATKDMDKDYTIVCHNGESAGQTDSQVHFHFIPRDDKDNLNFDLPHDPSINVDEVLEDIKVKRAEKLK